MKEEGRVDPVPVLDALKWLRLYGHRRRMLASARMRCGGPPAWRTRKLDQAHAMLALSQVSPRMQVLYLDLRQTLRALVFMMTPLPLRPKPESGLRVAHGALLGLSYREEAVRTPQPGFGFVQVLQPGGVFHPNVSSSENHGVQMLCLGESMPASIPIQEIVLASFAALSMQSVTVEESSLEGVMNWKAATWWQRHPDLLPLTRASFLEPGARHRVSGP